MPAPVCGGMLALIGKFILLLRVVIKVLTSVNIIIARYSK
jgi:hypothetical protein